MAVKARSIGRALEIVEGHNPGRQAEVAFPIDQGAFLVREAALIAGMCNRGPV